MRRRIAALLLLFTMTAALTGCGRSFSDVQEAVAERIEEILSDSELLEPDAASDAEQEAVSGERDEGGAESRDAALQEEQAESAAGDAVSEEDTAEKQATDLFGFPVERTGDLSGFIYDQLTEDVQEVYGQLYTGIADRRAVFPIRARDTEHIRQALSAVMTDHPEFFWLTGSAGMNGFESLGIWQISLDFNIPEDAIDDAAAKINAAAEEYLASLPEGASEYEKVKAAYEYIIFHTDYSMESEQNQNIQSVFINHMSVCAGYARAFKYLLDKAGVWCGYVEGHITDTGEGHAWNLVRIDGTYTYVDPSWGDPTYGEDATDAKQLDIIYDYLCMTSFEIRQLRHEPEEGIELPDCTDRSHDYYILNGLYYEGWNAGAVSDAIWHSVDEGERGVFLKFSDFESYAQAMAALFPEEGEDGLLKEPLQQRMEWDSAESMRYYYSYSDELWIIKIYW